ncbi:MAG: glycosyltransferase [Gaiellaceae bacterium]
MLPNSDMTHPFVTVITPAFNAERYLPETLESVLAQDYPNLEYIVLDDGSTDGTRAIDKRGDVISRSETDDFDYRDMLRRHHCVPGPGAFFHHNVPERLGGRVTPLGISNVIER